MNRPLPLAALALACASAIFVPIIANAGNSPALPPLKTQTTPMAVYDEHIAALNGCKWQRLMAQYPPVAQVHLPNGQVVKGREDIGKLFAGFVKPHSQGGLCGITFSALSRFLVGGTVNVAWVANASFLKKPYYGSDAYVTKDGLMYAMVSTFNGHDLVFKTP
jgi:hypothetical protein